MSADPRDLADLFAIADAVLERVTDGDAEVAIFDGDAALTRFASNAIHQNVASRGTTVRLRLQDATRAGVATVRGNVRTHLDDLVSNARRARDVSPPSTTSPLPQPDGGADAPAAYSGETAAATPEQRADAVATVVEAAMARSMTAYGALDTETSRRVVVNSRGLRRGAATTRSGLVAVARGDAGAGYAARCAVPIGDLDPAGLGAELVETCARNQSPEVLAPGDYEVVLAPYAVQTMLDHLSTLGFSGLAVAEQRSFMRPGERLLSDSISIYDDPVEAAIAPFPFDAEGVSTRRVDFISNGVCRDVIHDSATALRVGTASTGHALPMPNTYGPLPAHLAMAAGDRSVEELIAGVEDGLFVTRFWYVRDVHPLRTVITGMTREGTFRIKRGRLTGAVKDLRFTQSIVEALADVRGVGRDRLLGISEFDFPGLVPALHLGRFTFSS